MYPGNEPFLNDPTLAAQQPVDESQLHSVLSQTQAQAQHVVDQARQHVGEAAGNVQDAVGQARDQVGDLAGKAQQQAGHIMNHAQDQAGHLAQDLRQQLSHFLTAQKDQAAKALADIALAALHISEQLRADGQIMLADAVATVATHLQQFAGNLQEKSLDQLVHDIEQGARVQTVLLLAGGIVLGLMSTRMARNAKHA